MKAGEIFLLFFRIGNFASGEDPGNGVREGCMARGGRVGCRENRDCRRVWMIKRVRDKGE